MNKKHITLQITLLLWVTLSSGCSYFRMPKDIAQINNETSAIQKELTDLKSSMDDNTRELNAGIQADNDQLKDEISSINKQLDELKADSAAQSQKLNADIQKNDSQLKESFSALDEKIGGLNDAVQADSNQLKKETAAVKEQLGSLKSSLDAQNQKLVAAIQANNNQAENYSAVYESMNTQQLYWIIAVLVLLVGVAGAFFLLKNKMTRTANTLSSELITRLEELKTEIAQLDTTPIPDQKPESKGLPPAPDAEPDHSLPIKVCEEIQRMRNRMKYMDQGDQATKVFRKRLASLEETLNERGYEMVNLENTPYNDGMTVKANFISDENMKKGEEIITRVIKPQINYKDVLIQAAEVEVSQGV